MAFLSSLYLAVWQSAVAKFLQNPLAFLQAQLSNWPLLIVAGVLLLAALLLLKRLPGLFGSGGTEPVQFPGDEESFRSIFEATTAGVGILDRQERILFANAAFQKMLGYDLEKLRSEPLSNLAHPEDAHSDKAPFDDLAAGHRQQFVLERRFYHQDGRLLWLRQEVVARNFAADRSQPGASRAVGAIFLEDITRRKHAETELQVAREALHNLYGVIVDRQLDLLEKMSALLAMGCRRFDVETGVIGQIVSDGFEILQVVSPDERLRRGKLYERSTQVNDGPEAVTARHHRLRQTDSAQVEGAGQDWRSYPFYSVADVEVFLSAPINVLGQTFGVLCFSGIAARQAPFASADREFLQLMAQWLGGELERLQALAELETKQQALMEANTKLESLATIDGLTGSKNRRAFDEQLEAEYRRARRYSTPLSLMLLDVDKFKSYNDTLGHLAGDEVLKMLAQVLMKNVRVIDFVARYGGEEFVVLLPNTDADGAMILADRLRIKIESAPWPNRGVTSSFGVSSLTDDITEASQLTDLADKALYASKEAGRNVCTHVSQLVS